MGTSVGGVRAWEAIGSAVTFSLVVELRVCTHFSPCEDACLYRVNGAIFHPS